ncbi:unnamed protein product, partial [Ectocarpus sp. 8 AP-2014]
LLGHLPIASQEKIILGEPQAIHECAPHVHTSLGRGAGNVTAVMWRDLVEAYQHAEGEASEEGISEVPSWRQTFMSLSGKAVRSATENGTFDDLR